LGYTDPPESLVDAVLAYANRRYGWQIKAEWLMWLPGLVTGINLACRSAGKPGDAVVTAIPVYPPFLRAPDQSLRELITVPLINDGEQWVWDFERLESAITPRTRLLLLCHPHNPVGRAWNEDELRAIAELARRRDLIVCSDEIHCDLLLERGVSHTPFATVDDRLIDRTVTLFAPSKTWNLPGMGCSFAVIPDPDLRRRFRREMAGLVPRVTALGYAAAEAAYRDDGVWLSSLIDYLRGNRALIQAWFSESANLSLTLPQATYLAWIDARAIDATNPLPIFEEMGVGLSDGREFGFPGYLRLNFGCRRAVLEEALDRLSPLKG
jgi:cystathionine beta-lyase